MAKKSRHKRKQSLQRKQGRDITTAAVAPQQPAAPTAQPVAPIPQSAAPPIKEAAPTITRQPYIGTELRRIGMLAGILITVLVVLALNLS